MNGNIRTVADVEAELRFKERFLVRLRESFQLEKEDALEGGADALVVFRERSRTYYQPVALKMLNEYKLLRYKMTKIESIPSSIFLRLDVLEKAIKDARAHFAGAPNRLLRNAGENTGED